MNDINELNLKEIEEVAGGINNESARAVTKSRMKRSASLPIPSPHDPVITPGV